MVARSIDEVIVRLDEIIDQAHADSSRLGYFPALYRRVTVAVRSGIGNGLFENGARMERLDVLFALRYLEAMESKQRGQTPTRSWQVAFDAAEGWRPIVLQHLLLGMNAHINLDLGIAAAATAPGAALEGLRRDFLAINQILGSLVEEVKDELAAVWPHLTRLDRLAGTAEDRVVDFSMTRARDCAWELATRLARMGEAERAREIDRVDRWVAEFGRVLWKPGPLARLAGLAIRLGERGDPRRIIEVLSRRPPAVSR